jgi:uncharacterized repeat protein (TIGR01451 family)
MKNKIFSAFLCLAMIAPPTTRAASSGVAEFVSSTTNQSAFVAPPAETTVYQLLAGQRIDAGTVTVFTTDGGQLVVTYRTTGPWKIRETHLELALRVQDFPRVKNGNPQPGHFDYGGPQAPGTTAVQYVFNLGPDVPAGTALLVGAHAVVTGNGNETAWSAGKPFGGSNWFTYSTYTRPARGRELAVVKAFETDLQLLGYEGEFTITVTNNGPDAAGAIVVTDALDLLFESVDARVESGNGLCSIEGESAPFVLSCNINSLLVGESAVVRVEYLTTYARTSGTLVNCATAKDSDGNSAQGCASVPYVPGPV